MPANRPILANAISRFVNWINSWRMTPAEVALEEKTSQIPTDRTMNVRGTRQHVGAMGIPAGEANFLALETRLLGADKHFMKAIDIGTFTGRSALAMAQAMPNGGEVIACEMDEYYADIAKQCWSLAGKEIADRIKLKSGKADDTLTQLLNEGGAGTYDIIFIDADKPNYERYYEKALKLLRPGGLVILDNMLWSGSTAYPKFYTKGLKTYDESTAILRNLNERIAKDVNVDATLLSFEDGVMVAQKRVNGEAVLVSDKQHQEADIRHKKLLEHLWSTDVIPEKKEEIAVIGGGLGGCLTALMLAKNPRYHVQLIEAQDKLLNGASVIASRLHLGGEYPLDPETAQDCLKSAVAWKLLMPNKEIPGQENIFTSTPAMKFLVANKTEEDGRRLPEDSQKLTVNQYFKSYEKIRESYEGICKKMSQALGWDEDTTQKNLFGSYKEGEFFKRLKPEDYDGYKDIAGGFQSPELGLNVPKYLALIQAEIEKQEKLGNIAVLKGYKVKNNGIKGEKGNFSIRCENGEELHASQVVKAAWSGGPAITPQIGNHGERGNITTVYRRAMLLINLPPGHKVPPAFVMLGENGGMFAPYNDKIAICYLPVRGAAYIKDHPLTNKFPSLPEDWDHLSNERKEKLGDEYLALLKKRFPFLEGATKKELIVRDTLNFQKELHQRRHEQAEEATVVRPARGMRLEMRQKQELQQWQRPHVIELERGHFTLYPTKATYAVGAALQAVDMVEERSRHPRTEEKMCPKDILELVSDPQIRERYSLGALQAPDDKFYDEFFKQHADLHREMMLDSWPQTTPDGPGWTEGLGTIGGYKGNAKS